MKMKLSPFRFARAEDGGLTVEFAILFPAFIAIMLASIEASIYMARHVMLERSVDLAVREMRLNTSAPPSFDEFKDLICGTANMIRDCEDVVQVELDRVDTQTWVGLGDRAICRDVESQLDPIDETNYTVGGSNDLMMVRVCALYDPILPTTQLGLGLQRIGEKHAIVVTFAFVAEPSGPAQGQDVSS